MIRTLVKLPGQRPVWVMAERSFRGLERAMFGEDIHAGCGANLTVEKIGTDLAVAYRPRRLRVEKKTGVVPEFNCSFLWRDIYGPLLIVGLKEEKLCDVPDFFVPSLWFGEEKR